jgi:dephospho-CoA kinase
MLEELGVTTVNADQIGHDVIAPDGPAFGDVVSRWPEVVTDGRIDRKALAAVVFSDSAALAELEAITHPHIFGRIGERLQNISGVAVVEVPLLNRPAFEEWRRLVVDCADDIRVARAIERGMEREDVEARMASQPSRASWLASADMVVPNHKGLEELWTTAQQVVPNL